MNTVEYLIRTWIFKQILFYQKSLPHSCSIYTIYGDYTFIQNQSQPKLNHRVSTIDFYKNCTPKFVSVSLSNALKYIMKSSCDLSSLIFQHHKKGSFPLRISSVNVIKSADCGFGHIY